MPVTLMESPPLTMVLEAEDSTYQNSTSMPSASLLS